jgi:hypothetical protein
MYFKTLNSPFLNGTLEALNGAKSSRIDSVESYDPIWITFPRLDNETVFLLDAEGSISAAGGKVGNH